MSTRGNQDSNSDVEFFRTARRVNNQTFYLAIAIIIFVAVIAMTGVYFEIW